MMGTIALFLAVSCRFPEALSAENTDAISQEGLQRQRPDSLCFFHRKKEFPHEKDREKHRGKSCQPLSAEEYDVLRQQMRSTWQRLSAEEQARFITLSQARKKEKSAGAAKHAPRHTTDPFSDEEREWRHAYRVYWKSLSEQERAVLRDKLREAMRQHSVEAESR
ncbi:MAG: hypothetical protein LBG69_08545 [Zoogloeaceae bacterium]|nr:hypothetical protein [Zoogloeaceae bacterium]